MKKKTTKKLQQGGVSGIPTPYYGEIGNLLSSIIGGVNSSPNFQPKQNLEPWGDNIANQYVEDIKKEMGLKKDPRFFGILGTRWVDANGNKYTEDDLKKMAGARYDSNKAGIKSYNEQLPLAGGMAMLFDIQQREADSAQNTKTNISDVEYSKASPWPAGFSMQQGGSIPTTKDSLELYNNAVKVLNFYGNKKDYKKTGFSKTNKPIEGMYHYLNDKIVNNLGYTTKGVKTVAIIKNGKQEHVKVDNYIRNLYRKEDPTNTNRYYQRELANSILNIDAPMQLFDRRIDPSARISYFGSSTGDLVGIHTYEPLLVKPINLLTDRERERKAELEKYYGITKKDSLDDKNKKVVDTLKRIESYAPKERTKEDIKTLDRIKSLVKSNKQVEDLSQINMVDRNYGLSDFGKDSSSVPNVKVLYNQQTKEPAYYENSIGQRLPYGEKLTKKFQYPGSFEDGGRAMLGYKDISPYKNLPFQTFNTDTLTMDGVGKTLLAIADNGQRKLMLPNSGLHKFPGAKSIMEIPMVQDGGVPGHYLVEDTDFSRRSGSTADMPVKRDNTPYSWLKNKKDVEEIFNAKEKLTGDFGGSKMILERGENKAINEDVVNFISLYTDLNGIDIELALASLYEDDSEDNPLFKMTTSTEERKAAAKKAVEKISQKLRVSRSDMQDTPSTSTGIIGGWDFKKALEKLRGSDYFDSFFNGEYKQGGMVKKYKNGGYIVSSQNNFKKDLPVGNSDTLKGVIYIEDLLPIQAEKGELILTPTKDVVPVNAKKRHSQMDDDDVTDLAPANSYIFSKFGDVKIYKELAEDVTLQVENSPYNMFGKNPEPKTKTLADFMNKKVMAPADLVQKVVSKYKVVDNEGDLFTEETNRQNKMNRSPILNAIVNLSELDKGMKGLNEAPVAFRNGGLNLRGVRKAQTGAEIGAISNVASSIVGPLMSVISDYYNREAIKKTQDLSYRDINANYDEQSKLTNASLFANLAGILGQNPTIDPTIQSSTYLDQIPTEIPRQFTDYNIAKLYANKPNFSGYNPQVASLLMDKFYAGAQDAQSQFALNAGIDRANRKTSYFQAKQALQNSNEANRVNALNLTRTNANNLMANAAGAISGNITDRQNLMTNKLNAILASRGQTTSGLIQLNNQFAQNMTNSAATVNQALQSYFNNSTQNVANTQYKPPAYYGANSFQTPNTGYNFFDTSTWFNNRPR